MRNMRSEYKKAKLQQIPGSNDNDFATMKDIETLEASVYDRLDDLEAAVGDATSGLVQAVGDESSGLVKGLADITAAVGAPTFVAATIDATDKIVLIELSHVAFSAEPYATAGFKGLVQIATDGVTFGALAAADAAEINGKFIKVTFDAALTTATNVIKIAAAGLLSSAGVANALITTSAIDATA